MLEIHLRFIGVLLIGLAVLHAGFPRYFNWSTELQPLQLINRQLMVVHTFFIALVVLLMGILCLSRAPELRHTSLGRDISLGLGMFWLMRLIIQWVGYSAALWRGKRFETAVHIGFTVLWAYLTVIFMLVYGGGW